MNSASRVNTLRTHCVVHSSRRTPLVPSLDTSQLASEVDLGPPPVAQRQERRTEQLFTHSHVPVVFPVVGAQQLLVVCNHLGIPYD